LAEGIAEKNLPHGTLQGVNDWHRTGYGGPCPPTGKHRYFFKLYALDIVLPDLGYPAKAALEKAMRDHVAGQAELIGLYQRSR
jgi:Raf kinase inhibitor-like YbhB/YbcL family protein